MWLPTPLVFAIASSHIAAVTILLIYSLTALLQLKYRNVDRQKTCAKLNVIVPITTLLHACSSFVLMLNGYWAAFCLDLLVFRWTFNEIVKNRDKGIYDVNTMLTAGHVDKHLRSIYIRLMYFVVCVAIYLQYVIEGLQNPINWSVFKIPKTFYFMYTICIMEALLIIVAYSMVALLNIELHRTSPQNMRRNLNRLILVKTIIHSVLTCIMLMHSSWAFFASNLLILRWEIYKVASAKESNLDDYDPENIQQILKDRNYYRTCFLYYCACFGVYTYSILVGDVGKVATVLIVILPILLIQIEGGISCVLRFFLSNRQLRDHISVELWSIFMCLSEWSFVFVYCVYLAVWQQKVLHGNNLDWIMYLLIGVFYILCVTISIM